MKSKLIELPDDVFEELEKDAKRCRRSSMRHIEAIITAYLGMGNVELRDMTSVRESVRGAKVEAFATPEDTLAPLPRAKGFTESGRPDIDAATLSKLSDAELNELPYGVIRLAADGTILRFNKTEKDLSRVSHKTLIGQNFFEKIAPCSDVKEFRGRFERFLKGKKNWEQFEYTYDLPKAGTYRVLLVFCKESDSVGYVLSTKWRDVAERTG